jgi:proteasome assembly chaperone (PAC2) family protein
MARLVILAKFRDQATPPEGDPPSLTVHGESEEITLLEGDQGSVPESASYDTAVKMTGKTTFDESGTITFGDQGSIRVTTVGEGTLSPSAEEGVQHGSVIWRAEDGDGRFAGASGLITSNFRVQAEGGQATEVQVLDLFLA